MEHMAHPWAGPLSRGYMLDKEESSDQYHLAAVDVSHPKYPTATAELSWAKEGAKGYAPGEVAMVHNARTYASDPDPRSKGLAGALFHSAHHWNLGQSTVPIHSTDRSMAGEHFANKVRPDLKPDVWNLTGGSQEEEEKTRSSGKPAGEPAIWENVHYGFHPFQREELAQRAEADKKRSAKLKPRSPQGRLF
jgi:hypothetical protein